METFQNQLKTKDEQLETKVEDLSNKNVALTKKNEALTSKLGLLEKKDAHLMNKVTSLVQDMSYKNSALEKKNGELASKLAKLETSQNQLKNKNDHLMTKVEDLSNKNSALMKKNEVYASKFVSLEAKDSNFMSKVTSLISKNTVLEQEDIQLKAKLSDLESKVTKLKSFSKVEPNESLSTKAVTSPFITLVAGGFVEKVRIPTVEVISDKRSNQMQIPNLPTSIARSFMLNLNNLILLCGGDYNTRTCRQLSSNSWRHHSTLTESRRSSFAVSTHNISLIFGGDPSYGMNTYEYWTQDSSNWQTGKTSIPKGLLQACAVAISSDEVWLIGGFGTDKRILSFKISSHTFKVLPFTLNERRYNHACTKIPGTQKVLVSGGFNYGSMYSSEIIEISTHRVYRTRPMNVKRMYHGSGILTIANQEKVVVFGGKTSNKEFTDSIEVYDEKTRSWELLDMKLSQPKCGFGYLSIRKSDI